MSFGLTLLLLHWGFRKHGSRTPHLARLAPLSGPVCHFLSDIPISAGGAHLSCGAAAQLRGGSSAGCLAWEGRGAGSLPQVSPVFLWAVKWRVPVERSGCLKEAPARPPLPSIPMWPHTPSCPCLAPTPGRTLGVPWGLYPGRPALRSRFGWSRTPAGPRCPCLGSLCAQVSLLIAPLKAAPPGHGLSLRLSDCLISWCPNACRFFNSCGTG